MAQNGMYAAGMDYSGNALVVLDMHSLNAFDSALLSSLTSLLASLHINDPSVPGQYSFVLFSSPALNTNYLWLLNAYYSIEYLFKKNLLQLYIVHPSPWIKPFLQLITPIISPKFNKKIVWVNNIKELGYYIPMRKITISESLSQFDQSFTSTIPPPPLPPSILFSTPLSSLPPQYTSPTTHLPLLIHDCISRILPHISTTTGLFRKSPSSLLLAEVKRFYENNVKVDLNEYWEYDDVHLWCTLMKVYVRELPGAVFGSEMVKVVSLIAVKPNLKSKITYIKTQILPRLSTLHTLLLREIFDLLHKISVNSNINLMTSTNLALIWATNLLKSGNDNPLVDVQICTFVEPGSVKDMTVKDIECGKWVGGGGTVVKLMIEYFKEIFLQER
ncbi:hypothetical protein HK098_005635 [Nowakowskiella sp. JEL0407]|nr:hypothetical protein HK098_005635 [Nowakowskiella sp. JEL0407]